MTKQEIILEENVRVDLHRCHTVIVGSGAAGLNCAERLFDAGVKDIVIITSNLHGGTSYCSGSDKQTYYKMSVFGDTADSPMEMAHSLFDGGCMDGDLAYIESLYSLPAFYHLVENGVPFPFNSYGAFVGYKTDHDPRQRATSAGPKTSKYMVETSLGKVREKGIPVFDKTTVVKIATSDSAGKMACGLVAICEDALDDEEMGIVLFQSVNIVLAAGGPGELYESSVYPRGQVSLHGVALEAGASEVNLGESQFGITSTDFRWNLSGTYQQVIPSYFSIGPDGTRRNFLADYYRNLPEMASNIFLKGYQWPFSANRAGRFGSSLIDIAVEMERREGRRVFLDFTRNPSCQSEVFDIQSLSEEARDYLIRSNALQDTPYERLAFMNPESIEIYAEYGIDLREPLEIRVAFQHNNGGLAVNSVYMTDVSGLFAIGELAGTHGVSRPGGAALNAGQVGGIRAAQYISSRDEQGKTDESVIAIKEAGLSVLRESRCMLGGSDVNHKALRAGIQSRMTEACGLIRSASAIRAALSDGGSPRVGAEDKRELARAWETRNLVLTHLAFLKSIDFYIQSGGGSRGSYLILEEEAPSPQPSPAEGRGSRTTSPSPSLARRGVSVDTPSGGILTHREERPEDRRFRVKVTGPDLDVSLVEVKPLPEDASWFETTWAEWRSGRRFEDGKHH